MRSILWPASGRAGSLREWRALRRSSWSRSWRAPRARPWPWVRRDPLADPPPREWRPAVGAAKAYAVRRAGSVSFAVRTESRLYGYRTRRTARSASVVKAMLMVAYLNHRSVRGRRLRSRDLALITPMVRWSDNNTASLVRNFVGNSALSALARRVGMRSFAPMPAWGFSRDLRRRPGPVLPRDRPVRGAPPPRTAMRLLDTIVGSQRWGVARARPRGWALYFKGGWGSGSGAVDHQVALLRRGKRRVLAGHPHHRQPGPRVWEGDAGGCRAAVAAGAQAGIGAAVGAKGGLGDSASYGTRIYPGAPSSASGTLRPATWWWPVVSCWSRGWVGRPSRSGSLRAPDASESGRTHGRWSRQRERRWMAAVLACGEGAVPSHLSRRPSGASGSDRSRSTCPSPRGQAIGRARASPPPSPAG